MKNNIPMYQLSQEKALKFDIIQKLDPKNKNLIEFEFLKVEERKDRSIISIAFRDRKQKEIVYSRNSLDPYRATFLGWAFLVCGNDDSSKKKAKNLLGWAVYKNIDSCFPIYILANGGFLKTEGIEIESVFAQKNKKDLLNEDVLFSGPLAPFPYLFRALDKTDIFPDFYLLFDGFSINEIKMENILEEGWKKFPHNIKIFFEYAKYLPKSEKSPRECLEIIEKSKPWDEIDTQSFGGLFNRRIDPDKLVYREVQIHLSLEDFDGAKKVIEDANISHDLEGLLFGHVMYEQKDFVKAEVYFKEVIEKNEKPDGIMQASLYYLLNCYSKDFVKNKKKIETIIGSLEFKFESFIVHDIGLDFQDVARAALSVLVENDLTDEYMYRAKGILAYITYCEFLYPVMMKQDEITEYNRNRFEKGIKMAQEATNYYQGDKFLNELCSNFCYMNKKYDEAMKYALAVLSSETGTRDVGIRITLKDCSDEFLENYTDFLSKELSKHSFNNGVNIAEYVRLYLFSDLHALFYRKKHSSIVKLYNYLNRLEDITLRERLDQEYYRYLISYEKILPIIESSFKLVENAKDIKQEEKNKDEKDSIKKEEEYEYDKEDERGLLKIDGMLIKFPDEERALIIKYFFECRNVDTYKTYNDFKKKIPDLIKNSDTFNKKVKSINNEVRGATKEQILEVIKQNEDIKAPKQNNFKWSVMRMY